MASVTSRIEIEEDLRDRLVARLDHLRIAVPPKARTDVWEALVAYLRIPHRSVPARSRTVHRSRELLARQLILAPNVHVALQAVITELERGDDVNRRFTRYHFKAAFNDRLYNDLGVHHLHLGARDAVLDKSKLHLMAGGGKDLLCAVFRRDDVYLIDVVDHVGFDEYDFPKVLYDNWKHLLGSAMTGWTIDDADALSAVERAQARKAGLSTAVAINGEAFMPGHYMCDGTSAAIVTFANTVLNRHSDMHDWLEARAGEIMDGIAAATGSRLSELRLKVWNVNALVEGRVAVVEESSGCVISQEGGGTAYRLWVPTELMRDCTDPGGDDHPVDVAHGPGTHASSDPGVAR